jgi:two-component system, NtrC family, sensor kinase
LNSETLPNINIALISGGDLCQEILEMTDTVFLQDNVQARIVAVAEPDPSLPGVALARKQALTAVADYHRLFDPRHDIHLFILLDPSPALLKEILASKPAGLRVLSYAAFNLFWQAFKAKEGLLQQRTMEIETILNGIEDFFLVISPDQRIIEANEAFLSHMGYERDQVIGKHCYEVYHLDPQECFNQRKGCPIGEVIRNRRPAQTTRTRTDSQGKIHYMKVSLYPVWEKSGKISRFLEISHDVTDLKRREAENRRQLELMVEERTRQLEDTHSQLLHNDKMASLGKLSASVVHEINNPIAGILNLILLMKRIRNTPPETNKARDHAEKARNEASFDRYLDLMEAETRRISRIVSNLLTFSRQSKIELTRLNLNQLIKKTIFLNENLLKINHVKINTQLEPHLPVITASEDQLQQVFMNMISNAIEAMDAGSGGTLTIETGQDDGYGGVRICFKDTGVGISKDIQDKLFEPFFTTKKKSKGVGLGLSVAYGIIKAHQGAIAIESTVGSGTTFTIQLPLAPTEQRHKADEAPSRTRPEDR